MHSHPFEGRHLVLLLVKIFLGNTVKGTLGLENKEIAECAFFWDYYIVGWGEPMAKIFGLWVN